MMSDYEYGHPSQSTVQMTGQHVDHYLNTGELQLPLFDVDNFDDTWKTTDSFNERVTRINAKRQARLDRVGNLADVPRYHVEPE